MICCDICEEWLHGKCVGITSIEAKKIKKYVCPNCEKLGFKVEVSNKRKANKMQTITNQQQQQQVVQNTIIPVNSKPIQNMERVSKKRKESNQTQLLNNGKKNPIKKR
jgi:long-subunit acyl-CoA synthetase (AMP-forming)